MSLKTDKPVELAAAEEKRRITRQVIAWLNTCPCLPVKQAGYGGLQPGRPGVALVSPQGAVIRKRYICGGHLGEYPFSLTYRIVNPGSSTDKRLKADEALDAVGAWAASGRPDVGPTAQARRVEVAARAALSAVWQDGDEDHEIQLKLIYEVI